MKNEKKGEREVSLYKLVASFLFLVFCFSVISADVGLGISPSKIRDPVISGETYSIEILIFNTGSEEMDITLSYVGDLSDSVVISPSSQIIQPEPVPHEFPIKNGKLFEITFKIPSSSSEKTYKGVISAIGGGSGGSNFGGSVGVSSEIEMVSVPSSSFFSLIPSYAYFVLGGIVLLIVIVLLLKKMGFKIEFNKSKSEAVKKK